MKITELSELSELIHWWEEDCTPEKRTELMGDYRWHGSTEERHHKLREMHGEYLKFCLGYELVREMR